MYNNNNNNILYIYVLYIIGHDTKVMMSTKATKMKISYLEDQASYQIRYIILLLITIAFIGMLYIIYIYYYIYIVYYILCIY